MTSLAQTEPAAGQPLNPALLARSQARVPRYTSYPTAPHFTPAVNAESVAGWLKSLPQEEPISLYLHVPFCAELCLYCGCHTAVVRRYGPVAAFADTLEREIDLVAAAIGGKRRVSHLHWGGGTPTILNGPDLERITARLKQYFDFDPGAECAIEIDPRTLTREHVDSLARMGINRASLGVQDFDPLVQKTIGRIQSYEQTAAVASWLRAAGITGINLDLMYGLPHQTVPSVLETLDKALSLKPSRVALFGYAHVPWMKKHQALLPEEALPDTAERYRQFEAASEALIAAGYVAVGLDHFAKPEDPMAVALDAGALKRNFQGYTTDRAAALVGLGPSAIGAYAQGYAQNAPSTVAWRDAIQAGRLPIARGLAVSADDRLRREIIERLMCDLEVDVAAVAAAHGTDTARFADAYAEVDGLAAEGLASRQGDVVRVPHEARAFVRSVCAAFDAYLGNGQGRHAVAV